MSEIIDEKDYAVKYRVISLKKNKYLLYPENLEKGELCGYDFVTENGMTPILDRQKSLNEKYVIGQVYSADDLRLIYEDFEDGKPADKLDNDFLGDYYYTDSKDKIIYVETNDKKEIQNTLTIDLAFMQQKEEDATYLYNKDIAAVILNSDSLDTLLKTEDIKELKLLLNKYRKLVNSFKDYYDKDGITKVKVVNGKIDEIETNRDIKGQDNFKSKVDIDISTKTKKDKSVLGDFSYIGLRNYIKEYVFGQDETIDTLAQKLYMNITAEKGENIDSILLVGPTGTGKTETIEAASRYASEYLDIPYFAYNASNLNAEGIVGTSIENVLNSLYEMAGKDIEKAQRGIVFLDEYDKLNDSDLDTKTILKNILLTFNGGGKFSITSNHNEYTFDTSMTNKIYAGVFRRIEESNNKVIGFTTPTNKNIECSESDIRKRIIDKKYFTLEELSRISTILPYYELDRDTKIRILKESKLSTLAQKKSRYKRQFGLDIELTEDFINAIIEKLDKSETGMRSLNNILKTIMDCAEKEIISTNNQYKKLVLTRNTVDNPSKFDLM